MSDLVKQIEYVDAHGNLRVIKESDERFLKAASGCFGLMGVITHLTLEVDPMTYAEMWPLKVPTILAIPPPAGVNPPSALIKARDEYLQALEKETGVKKSLEQVEKEAQADFETRANEDYYAEWFWFPYADYVWVNTWKNTTDSSNVQEYPSKPRIFVQWIETVLMNVLQYTPLVNKMVDIVDFDQPFTTLICQLSYLLYLT